MIERWLRSPSTIIVLLLVVFCCAFGFIRFVLLRPEPLATVDISAALLKPSDSPLLQYARYVPSEECDRFLVPADVLWEGLLRCRQVQLTRTDITQQYLNAAWEYDSAERATAAVKIASTLPQLDGVELGVIEAPQVGTFSVVTYATVIAPLGDTHIQNIFWTHENILFRLSVISREPPSFNDLYALAVLIEGRVH